MTGKMLLYYFGDDEAYFRALNGEFGKHFRSPFEFIRVFENDEKKIQSLFLKVFQNQPACVFIDFSKCPQDYLHLARIITRTPLENKVLTVGLVDYLSPPEILTESIATGVDLAHIKSAETFDVIFDVAAFLAPNDLSEHGFATATLNETWEAGIPVKIGYVHNEGIHFETDFHLREGDRIRMGHHWLKKHIIPSKEMFIQKVSQKNLFYHFKYAVDAEFLFIDEFYPSEEMDQKKIQFKKADRKANVSYQKKQLKKWLDENELSSLEKKAKVLIIDREFNIYRDQPRSDRHPCTVRSLSSTKNIEAELNRLDPQVIAFSLEKDEVPEALNTEARLRELMEIINRKKSDPPYVVVFNSPTNSRQMHEAFGFKQIMATDNEISVDILLRMAEIFDKKVFSQPVKSESGSKVFLKKTHPATIGEILLSISVIKLSETNMIFQSEVELPIGINLHISSPVNMYINVQPSKTQGKLPEYQGMIHSMGETQKKELRKFVNSVFFRDHDAQVLAETDEFKKLNEAKLLERQEAQKAVEEAQKQAQESEGREEETPESQEQESVDP